MGTKKLTIPNLLFSESPSNAKHIKSFSSNSTIALAMTAYQYLRFLGVITTFMVKFLYLYGKSSLLGDMTLQKIANLMVKFFYLR
jgi:hypothetical protein